MGPLTPLLDQAEKGKTGTILGEEISMNGSMAKAVEARIKKRRIHEKLPIAEYSAIR